MSRAQQVAFVKETIKKFPLNEVRPSTEQVIELYQGHTGDDLVFISSKIGFIRQHESFHRYSGDKFYGSRDLAKDVNMSFTLSQDIAAQYYREAPGSALYLSYFVQASNMVYTNLPDICHFDMRHTIENHELILRLNPLSPRYQEVI